MGMTQKEFGEIIGVKQQTVCKYERVNTNVSLEVLQKISDAFGVKVEEMIEDNLERYIQSGNRRNISLEIEKDIINRVRKLNGKELKKLIKFLS
jgi:DNA-binding helix-turn-helix protein